MYVLIYFVRFKVFVFVRSFCNCVNLFHFVFVEAHCVIVCYCVYVTVIVYVAIFFWFCLFSKKTRRTWIIDRLISLFVFVCMFVCDRLCLCVCHRVAFVCLCVSVLLFVSGLVYIFVRICAYLSVFIRRCVYLCVKCVFLKSILEPLLSVTVFTLSFALHMHETVMLPTLGKSEIKISCGTITELNTLTHKLTHTHRLTQKTYRVPQTKEMIFTH